MLTCKNTARNLGSIHGLFLHLHHIQSHTSQMLSFYLRVCVCVCVCVCVFSHFSHVQLCNPMDYRPPGSSVHGMLQARVLVWVSISPSRGSSSPRGQTFSSCVSCIGRWVLYHWCHLFSLVPFKYIYCGHCNVSSHYLWLDSFHSSLVISFDPSLAFFSAFVHTEGKPHSLNHKSKHVISLVNSFKSIYSLKTICLLVPYFSSTLRLP